MESRHRGDRQNLLAGQTLCGNGENGIEISRTVSLREHHHRSGTRVVGDHQQAGEPVEAEFGVESPNDEDQVDVGSNGLSSVSSIARPPDELSRALQHDELLASNDDPIADHNR